jgi:peptidoglycan hydrolase-like protein with peptidoglycan-binding domain
MECLGLGSSGYRVERLQRELRQHEFDPGEFDGRFGPGTDAALRAFQRSVGLPADGVAGANTVAALRMPSVTSNIGLKQILPMFPATPRANTQFHLPYVLKALSDAELADKSMVLVALGTIRAEAATFQPVEEVVSLLNTSAGGHPFDRYDHRQDLGNQGPPDGARFRGRGFVQLTGRANYQWFSKAIGLGRELVDDPDRATDPDIAARLLAAFLKDKEGPIRRALLAQDCAEARKLVNGGSHGLEEFEDAFHRGQALVPDDVQVLIQ